MIECQYCLEDVADGDPFELVNGGAAALHRECMIRMVVGSVGHQRRACTCFGGTEEDPEGSTKREGALAAEKEMLVRYGAKQPLRSPYRFRQ
jgi:hypothetical protein